MKIIVLGAAGRMGSLHSRHLMEMGHTVYRVDPATGDNDFIDNADGIVIATPADRHHIDLQAALDAGLHAFIEKPICLIGHLPETRKIVERAKHKGLLFAVGYNLRFHPSVVRIKDEIVAWNIKPMWGSFILRQKPQRPLAHFLEEWASHEVDLALHLFGPANVEVLFGAIGGPLPEIRLMLNHDMRTSFIHVDAYTQPFRRVFTIVEQDGFIWHRDIEALHVQDDHYKRELSYWIDAISCAPDGVMLDKARNWRSATGEDGLAVIDLFERIFI